MEPELTPLPPALNGRNLRHTRTLTSAVTTAWGVNWDEVFIARDIMQNFYDANRGQLAKVCVAVDGRDVTITAPAAFNLERLFYLGSEKTEDDIGQYGEGFKVAATCLLRDHAVDIVAASGNDALRLRIAENAVRDTRLYPVEYDFFESDGPTPGTLLWLRGCSGKLARALQEGLNHFFHSENPLLGAKRWAHYTQAFSLYDSTDGKGHVFYRKLKRGEFEGIPVVVVIDKELAAIEKKIRKDRDRNAFGDEMMRLFFQLFARHGLKGDENPIRVIVEKARHCWVKGHPLLSEIAGTMYSPWSSARGREIFADKYYAKSTSRNVAEQMEFEALERTWSGEDKICLPQYFSKFGVLNAQRHFQDLKDKAMEEARRKEQHPPSAAETEAINVLSAIMRELSPKISYVFDRSRTVYTVAKTEAVLGELRKSRSYNSREVFLAAAVFQMDFSEALAVFLHEHAHVFGYDGHRDFSDALTELIETVVRLRKSMDEYEEQWKAARKNVARERSSHPASPPDGHQDWLANKTEAELRTLLLRVPPVVLRKLRRDNDGPVG